MATPEIIDSPKAVLAAAHSYAQEALETIAKIMRTSQSEKMRLLAAMSLLDRATVPRAPAKAAHEAPALPPGTPALEKAADMRSRVFEHLQANPLVAFDEHRLKTELGLRSPATAIRAACVQMNREALIGRTVEGKWQSIRTHGV